jgi:uncharacterized protein (TIGR03000 family)
MTAAGGTPTPAPKPADKSALPADKPAEKPAPSPSPGIPGITPPVPDAVPGITPPVRNTSIESSAGQSGVLTVWVPNDAKVTINGLLTKSTGSKRQFVSYGLQPGYTYNYEVKAEVVREGRIVTESQTVAITAGERGGVAFGFNVPPSTVASTEGQ